jgi:hypothetical protein
MTEEVQNITFYVTAAFIAGILLYDVWAYSKAGTRGTVSYMVIIKWSRRYPAFTFAVGFVMGHLFWPLSVCT